MLFLNDLLDSQCLFLVLFMKMFANNDFHEKVIYVNEYTISVEERLRRNNLYIGSLETRL